MRTSVSRRSILMSSSAAIIATPSWSATEHTYYSSGFLRAFSELITKFAAAYAKIAEDLSILTPAQKVWAERLPFAGAGMRIASTAATSVDQLTRHNKEPIDIYDNRMIDAALSDLAWFAGKIKVVAAGPVGGLLALAPELERFLADRDRNPQRSFEMGLKLYVKFTGLLIGYAIGMVLVDAAVWSLPAWTVGSIVAGIGGAAYDFARNGSHFREIGQELSTAGAGIADLGARLAIVFGAISHAAERVALPLHMTIEDFFGHDRRFLDPIGPLRAAAANRRYAEGASNVVTRTTHSAWSERCVDGLCTRTYRQKPPRDDPWLFGGGGGGGGGGGAGGGPRPQRPPPAELVGGVTVDPKPVASRRDPDAQGAAALKARPSTANPAIREIP